MTYRIILETEATPMGMLEYDQTEEVTALRLGLEASDAGRVRSLAEVAAERRAKYHLPTHLSDEEIFSGEEDVAYDSGTGVH